MSELSKSFLDTYNEFAEGLKKFDCDYDEERIGYEFIIDTMKVCGCAGYSFIYKTEEILSWIADNWDKVSQNLQSKNFDDFVTEVFYGDEGLAYLSLNILDNAELLEHGTSIRHSWLTPDGYDMLIFIKQYIEKLNGE